MASRPQNVDFEPQLPVLAPWMRNLLVGLVGIYVVELVVAAQGTSVLALAYNPLDAGFQPWQLLTRLLVERPDAPFTIVFAVLMLYFMLPEITRLIGGRALAQGMAWTLVTATLVVLAVDGLGALGWVAVPRGPLYGWTSLVFALFCWFGLAHPGATVRMFFVLPLQASWFLWISLGIAALNLLSALAVGSSALRPIEELGVWLGAFTWWHLMGPGSRRRQLKAKARGIERELSKLRVIPGGRH